MRLPSLESVTTFVTNLPSTIGRNPRIVIPLVGGAVMAKYVVRDVRKSQMYKDYIEGHEKRAIKILFVAAVVGMLLSGTAALLVGRVVVLAGLKSAAVLTVSLGEVIVDLTLLYYGYRFGAQMYKDITNHFKNSSSADNGDQGGTDEV